MVTTKEKTKKKLLPSDESFQHIVERSEDGMLIVNDDDRVLYANPAAIKLFEERSDALVGDHFGVKVSDGIRDEMQIVRSDGTLGVGELTTTRTRWQGQSVYLIIIRDISERTKATDIVSASASQEKARRKALEALEEAERRARIALEREVAKRKMIEQKMVLLTIFPDENPNPVMRVHKDGTLQYANTASKRVLKAWGAEMGKILPAKWRHEIDHALERHETGHSDFEIEFAGRVLQFTVAPIEGADFLYLYCNDITDERRLDQMKDEFISTVSHELRTPLSIVSAAVGNLLDGTVGNLTDQQRRVVETTSRNMKRLGRLIHDLLDLSRLESGRMRIDRKVVHIKEVLEDVVKTFSSEIAVAHLEFVAEIPADLPLVHVDPDMIHQVLVNLIGNAMRYAKHKIVLRVTSGEESIQDTSFKQDDPLREFEPFGISRQIMVSVTDDGPGVAKEDQERLFNKFEQIHRAKGPGYHGTGLGLAISKEIVDQHAGKIWVESEKGKGATFFIALPTYNERKALYQMLEHTLDESRRAEEPSALIVIRLDNASEIARQLTLDKFSELGQDIRRRIVERVLRSNDSYFCVGGDHHFVILPATAHPGAEAASHRIADVLKGCAGHAASGKIPCDFSFGLAVYPSDAGETDGMVRVVLDTLPERKELKASGRRRERAAVH